MNRLKPIFSFPDPVNEVAARLVAGMVVILSLAFIATANVWVLAYLTYEFLARVASGPTLSPMGLLATRVLVPMLGNPAKLVPGPPKRFAQGIGFIFSATALGLLLLGGNVIAAQAIMGIIVVFATLESVLGFCMACFIFGYLIKWGLVPQSVCERCVVDREPALR